VKLFCFLLCIFFSVPSSDFRYVCVLESLNKLGLPWHVGPWLVLQSHGTWSCGLIQCCALPVRTWPADKNVDIRHVLCAVFQYRLQPPAHAGFSLADSSTLKMEAICSSETSVHAIYTAPHPRRRHSLSIQFHFHTKWIDTTAKIQRTKLSLVEFLKDGWWYKFQYILAWLRYTIFIRHIIWYGTFKLNITQNISFHFAAAYAFVSFVNNRMCGCIERSVCVLGSLCEICFCYPRIPRIRMGSVSKRMHWKTHVS
jgi:hypothetical protein